VIYTGGYPNNAVRLLVERIAEKGERYVISVTWIRRAPHFPGYRQIGWRSLRTLLMDVDVNRRYLAYGSPFPAAAGARLRLLTNPLILPWPLRWRGPV
jgi:hypothetical protein